MHSPTFLLVLLASAAVIAVVCIVLTGVYWYTVGRVIGDFWVKVVAKCIQLAAAYTSLRGAYEVAVKKDEWWEPAVAGVICGVLWEVLEKLVDYRVKAAERIDKARTEQVERESEARTGLLAVFRSAVNDKIRRLGRANRRRTPRPSLLQIRTALTPDTHLEDLLQNLAVFFAAQLTDGTTPNRNFRVGLYGVEAEGIRPLQTANLNNPNADTFTSYRDHPEAFRLDGQANPSQVVQCIRQRRTLIVEDCAAAADRGEFTFFTADQRGYLRSMVAYYLDAVCGWDGMMRVAALVVDTDAPGFFREADRDSLEFCLREFGSRLKLELLLHSILTARGQADEDPHPGREGEAAG